MARKKRLDADAIIGNQRSCTEAIWNGTRLKLVNAPQGPLRRDSFTENRERIPRFTTAAPTGRILFIWESRGTPRERGVFSWNRKINFPWERPSRS